MLRHGPFEITTLNVADWPTVTVSFAGCVVIAGVTCAELVLAARIEEKNNKANRKLFFPGRLCTVLSLYFGSICETASGASAALLRARSLEGTEAVFLNLAFGWGAVLNKCFLILVLTGRRS
jgi:hypothetical protein